MDFDVRSAMLLSSLFVGMMAFVMFFLRSSFPATIRGISEWAIALTVLFVAFALFGLRGTLPEFLTLAVANLLVMFGLCLMYFGSQRHFGLTISLRNWTIFAVLLALPIIWYSAIVPNIVAQVALTTMFMVVAFGFHAHLILRHGSASFPNRFTAFVLASQGAINLLRLLSLLFTDDSVDFYGSSVLQVAYVTSLIFGAMLGATGLTLMASNRLREDLEHLARHDSLTGCLNRRAWLDSCDQEMDRSRRSGRQMTLLMMDIDHFKSINDNHGHQVGDRVIVSFVKHVIAALRRADSLGRYGGEEFVALLPETGAEQALIVAERIRNAVHAAAEAPACTVSIGVATSDVNVSVDGLLARADAAMYRAKSNGRNRVETA